MKDSESSETGAKRSSRARRKTAIQQLQAPRNLRSAFLYKTSFTPSGQSFRLDGPLLDPRKQAKLIKAWNRKAFR